ncbi:hypothetical protein GCM10010399_66910 [Dactylosporangium fulvum]|uniref:Uncharacterized protein n=1 Tax=Dactylosporangium fulvum TaxID=53359 RepID=A0ABY5VZ20_9ACTN|nr:hypothetical protein [Dactylosporangium fulvum]UWP83063.1 hypothetical protein Dfulv_01770 [Dactylosporangium fulvum]
MLTLLPVLLTICGRWIFWPLWAVAVGALSALLAATPPLAGTPDLLALAAQTAGAGAAVPGLAEVAARPGSSRLVTEARRLTRVLQKKRGDALGVAPFGACSTVRCGGPWRR